MTARNLKKTTTPLAKAILGCVGLALFLLGLPAHGSVEVGPMLTMDEHIAIRDSMPDAKVDILLINEVIEAYVADIERLNAINLEKFDDAKLVSLATASSSSAAARSLSSPRCWPRC